MSDRRQGDRRETSVLQKKVAISLSSFIYLCVIFVITIAAIVGCMIVKRVSYNKGYGEGYIEGYEVGYQESYYENYSTNEE